MPRKSSKPRKPGLSPLSTTKNRRAGRPEPAGLPPARPNVNAVRDRRFDRRPPKFPGRLGGR